MKNILNMLVGFFLAGLVVWGVYDHLCEQNGWKLQENEDVISGIKTGIHKGETAPNFKLSSLDSEEISLTELKGKRVLLNFWASWCPPCRAEMPHIEKFYKEYKDQNVIVIGINLSYTEDSIEDVSTFLRKYNVSFPILKDENAKVADLFAIRSYPTTYIIDTSGVIRQKFQGAITYDTMKTAVDSMN
ncbi:TlpA disulfide reductase family protein [Paenibacillus sp. DR312]|uniref:TlpA family protein disulfide reductase n=1 Tax=Paenibacillus sp. DR312 TaxID=2871175 RepID=UPI001C98412F|nr:TlpA disulfide reductase family protein [Paenibacillus sp. DR312]QZN75486.1 TlpA family protein disulfide reductase [Paenibacillus sp. DR312]